MAYTISLGDLVTYSQQLANQVGSEQIEAPEWKAHISVRYGRLHALVTSVGARCFETEVTLNLANLALPSDHLTTIGVDHIASSGRRRELPELMMQERNRFTGFTGNTEARAWSFSGVSLVLYPPPTTGTYKHLYVPQPAKYNTANDVTTLDLLTTDGLEAIAWGVASVALHRSESQQQRAVDESDAAMGRLKDWAIARALTMPKRQTITCRDWNTADINGAWNPASWRWNR